MMDIRNSAKMLRAGGLMILLLANLALANEPSKALEQAQQLNRAFVGVAETASQSVVVIQVYHPRTARATQDPKNNPWFDMLPDHLKKQLEEYLEKQKDQPAPPEGGDIADGKGSGIVISKDGYILTNYHVIEKATRIQVRLQNGRTYEARAQGQDPQSDVAVIKIEDSRFSEDLLPARRGDSDIVKVGEYVLAIGAPFELDYTVTFGHVSAKGRSGVLFSRDMDQDFIQTDANINPGNSGGPLVNLNGEVIGINTLIRGMNTGIGFSIPINMAWEVAEQIIETGTFTRARLGIGIESLIDNEVFNNLLYSVDQGVIVTAINPNGPAASSELRAADVIVAVDNVSVGTTQQLKNQVRSKPINEPLLLEIVRNNERMQLTIEPEEWPAPEVEVTAHPPRKKDGPAPILGLKLRTASHDLAEQFGVEPVGGLIITEVERNSLAAKYRQRYRGTLDPGSIITDINFTPVRTPLEFAKAYQKADSEQGILLIYRDVNGASRFAILKDGG